jgi:hypothetical protein
MRKPKETAPLSGIVTKLDELLSARRKAVEVA